MKTKLALAGALMLALCLQGSAEKVVQETATVTEGQEIRIDLKLGDEINIIPVKGNRFELNGTIDVNDGEDDDAYTVELDSNGHQLSVESHIDKQLKPRQYVEKYDEHGNVIASYWNTKIDARFDVRVPIGHALEIETINATLNLKLVGAPLKVKTINGEINLAIPDRSDLDLDIHTIKGDCLTDIPATQLKELSRKDEWVACHVRYRLNEGGTSVRMETINGYMYLLHED